VRCPDAQPAIDGLFEVAAGTLGIACRGGNQPRGERGRGTERFRADGRRDRLQFGERGVGAGQIAETAPGIDGEFEGDGPLDAIVRREVTEGPFDEVARRRRVVAVEGQGGTGEEDGRTVPAGGEDCRRLVPSTLPPPEIDEFDRGLVDLARPDGGQLAPR
jgi:hypothetical protein